MREQQDIEKKKRKIYTDREEEKVRWGEIDTEREGEREQLKEKYHGDPSTNRQSKLQ